MQCCPTSSIFGLQVRGWGDAALRLGPLSGQLLGLFQDQLRNLEPICQDSHHERRSDIDETFFLTNSAFAFSYVTVGLHCFMQQGGVPSQAASKPMIRCPKDLRKLLLSPISRTGLISFSFKLACFFFFFFFAFLLSILWALLKTSRQTGDH